MIGKLVAQADIVEIVGQKTELRRRGRELVGLCPFHVERQASLTVSPEKKLWHCFGCGRGGGVLHFIAECESCTMGEAARLLGERLGIPLSPLNAAEHKAWVEAQERDRATTDLLARICAAAAEKLPDSPGLDYLRGRGLSADALTAFGVGYSPDDALVREIARTAPDAVVEASGIFSTGRSMWCQRIIVPLGHGERVISIYSRSADTGPCEKPHLYLAGRPRPLFNADRSNRHEPVLIVEGILDAISAWQLGYANVIGTGGTDVSDDSLHELRCVERVLICFDAEVKTVDGRAEEPGRQAALELSARLGSIGVRADVVDIPLPDGEAKCDVNDLLRAGTTPEEFRALLDDAMPPATFARRHSLESPMYLLEVIEDGYIYREAEYEYRVDSFNFGGGEGGVKCTLSISKDDQRIGRDKVSLSSAKERRRCANACADLTEAQREHVQRHLLALEDELVKLAIDDSPDAGVEERAADPMTAEERDEALALLRDDDFLTIVADHLDALGVVGEDAPKVLTYLVMTSRITEEPLAACFKAQSATGKSHLLGRVARLCPPEDLRDVTRMTAHALYYAPADYVKGKFVIVRERAGGDDADYAIRTMLSERGLVLLVPTKDETGAIVFAEKRVNGPMAYAETTTKLNINLENETRVLEIHLDERSEQTERILARQRADATLAGIRRAAHADRIIRHHRNAQRLLRPLTVTIPYAPLLQFPAAQPRARRDQAKFMELIKTVALCRQYRKETKVATLGDEPVEYIEADMTDYTLAYRLSASLFASTLDELNPRSRDLLGGIRNMVEERVSQQPGWEESPVDEQERRILDVQFTRRDIGSYTHVRDRTLVDRLRPLEESGYLHVVQGGKGQQYVYKLSGLEAPDPRPSGLLTPEQLATRIRAARSDAPTHDEAQGEQTITRDRDASLAATQPRAEAQRMLNRGL